MMPAAGWLKANHQLIAKSLQELSYEQVITPEEISANSFRLPLKSGVVYTFNAWRGLWTDLKVQPESIFRNGLPASSAGQFFIDSQAETAMDDIILGNFLEEMHNSLYADIRILERSRPYLVSELLQWSGERIQMVLSGHPKILLSKGRIGWSASDQDQFGPENQNPVQLLWLAARIANSVCSRSASLSVEQILSESFSKTELTRFKQRLQDESLEFDKFNFIPVHPWQWNRYIKIQFASELESGNLIFLGAFGDMYLPQISLRTFSNISRPDKMDIKLPMTILNTSSIRGIPAKYIPQGPRLSEDLTDLCSNDPLLKNSNLAVLEEKAGVAYTHPLFKQVTGAPYRYQEFLGAIWRQSTHSLLQENEIAIIAGSLFHQDRQGDSLIGAYMKASGLSKEVWLRRYFETVVLPLYHLQILHGVGLVAHGQNVVVRLQNFIPTGLLLKDFQGDLRMTLDSKSLNHDLTRLPPHYLIHDLITGHFVTVLRFVSETLQNCDGFAEKDFYRLLGEVLTEYKKAHPELTTTAHFAAIDLLQPTFPRVLVNRVRFKIGYADSMERPLPLLGDELRNPIHLGLHGLNQSEASL